MKTLVALFVLLIKKIFLIYHVDISYVVMNVNSRPKTLVDVQCADKKYKKQKFLLLNKIY